MANGFNIDNLEITEPQSLYSMLNRLVELGQTEAVTAGEDASNNAAFFLGGLLSSNLMSAGLDDETVGRLRNALGADNNLSYAVFPQDRARGYIPLVLNENGRAYIEHHLPELLSNQQIKWYVYALPTGIDADANETAGATLLTEDVDGGTPRPKAYAFHEIADALRRAAGYSKQDDYSETEGVDAQVAEADRAGWTATQTPASDSEELFEDVAMSDKYTAEADADSEDEDAFFAGEEDEDEDAALYEREMQARRQRDAAVAEAAEESPTQRETATDEADTSTSDADAEDVDTPADDTQALVDTSDISAYTTLPPAMKDLLESIHIPRFEPLNSAGIHPDVYPYMEAAVKQANTAIENIEQELKTKAIARYTSHMQNSHARITEETDGLRGHEKVREYHDKMEAEKQALRAELQDAIAEKKKALEEDFYGPQFEEFKKAWLAQARVLFEEEYYADRVAMKLDAFEAEENEKVEAENMKKQASYDDWVEGVKIAARERDAFTAVQETTDFTNAMYEGLIPRLQKIETELEQANRMAIAKQGELTGEESLNKQFGKFLAEKYEPSKEAEIYKQERDALAGERNALADANAAAQEDSARISALVNDFLEQQRAESGKQPALSPEDLRAIVAENSGAVKSDIMTALEEKEQAAQAKRRRTLRIWNVLTGIFVTFFIVFISIMILIMMGVIDPPFEEELPEVPDIDDVEIFDGEIMSVPDRDYQVGDMFRNELDGETIEYRVIDTFPERGLIMVEDRDSGDIYAIPIEE